MAKHDYPISVQHNRSAIISLATDGGQVVTSLFSFRHTAISLVSSLTAFASTLSCAGTCSDALLLPRTHPREDTIGRMAENLANIRMRPVR